jgi:hypothetical protein
MPKLASEVVACTSTISRLEALHTKTAAVEVQYRKLICEIVLLRLFYLLENSFKGVACRVASGATYGDGSAPALLTKCKSMVDAEHQMKTLSRAKPRGLRWSTASEVKENVEFVLDSKDHFVTTIDAHGAYIDEVRRVRNRIAHNNTGARGNFRVVVKRYYGAALNQITPGTLLLSDRRNPTLIEDYLARGRVLVKALAKM